MSKKKTFHSLNIGSSSKVFDGLLNPKRFVERICNLRGPKKIIISHKPIKWSAKFKESDKVILDFRKDPVYIALSVAHEYTHLILRYNNWHDKYSIQDISKRYKSYRSPKLRNDFLYSIEQSIAILVQTTYEKSIGIKQANKKHVQELMKLMDVWEAGKWYLKHWPQYYKESGKNFRSAKFKNILSFIQSVAETFVL